ncbi:ATP-binding cassette domain-containing protein, partial [uncultured Methylobacterium sp.]|uniref:ATP-binding cassette domain-containing protein n=1 Tax=uncultured Methylobacterium sp. TaxID=157278 RepID=UPI0035C95C26
MPETDLMTQTRATPAPVTAPLLSVKGLQGWYGESHVLHGIDLDVRAGEVVTLLGRNGAGKTTTLKAIIGILARRTGSITYDGIETIGMASRNIARLGLGYVPEERGIFASLTVAENLMLPPVVKPGGMAVA